MALHLAYCSERSRHPFLRSTGRIGRRTPTPKSTLTSPRFLADGHGHREPGGEEDMREFPRLVVEVLRAPRAEVADGWEELRRVHGSTHPLPRTSSRAADSAMPSPTSLRMRCSCFSVADWPGANCPEPGSADPSDPSDLKSR